MQQKSLPKVFQGQIDHISSQSAYLIVEGLAQDIFIPYKYLKGAMHQDVVQVVLRSPKSSRRGKAPRQEGQVIKILERTHKKFIGTFKTEHGDQIAIPTHKRFHYPILLPNAKKENFLDGHKAWIEILKYPKAGEKGQGKIIKVLGPGGEYNTETSCLMEEFGLTSQFPSVVQKEVQQISDTLSATELQKRRDFREVTTFTIDPMDAKDFDDAISIQKIADSTYEIGVHIADVTHYVKEGSELDKEAYKRGNSTYLVGKCVPMLPERLSNNLCSLKPHTIRPAFSVVFKFTAEAIIKDCWIGETIIHSNHRFTYETAQKVLEEGRGLFHKELKILNDLAQKMRKKRVQQGAIPFGSTDLQIKLDEKNNPAHIGQKETSPTHKLIEEFMLIANKTVAEQIFKQTQKKKLPFIYREHKPPETGKLDQFLLFLNHFGFKFDTSPKKIAYSYQKIIQEVEGTSLQHVIQTMAIRTMSQALYTTKSKEHFGLGFMHYTHFTSPIRRYADLIVHRLFKRYAQTPTLPHSVKNPYEEIAQHISSCEQAAKSAERASINYTQARFMQDKTNQIFPAVISGLTEWGIYAEIQPYKCEGMIRIAEIPGDYYIFDTKNFCIRGKRTNVKLQLGDTIRVLIKKCNLDRRTIDLQLAIS